MPKMPIAKETVANSWFFTKGLTTKETAWRILDFSLKDLSLKDLFSEKFKIRNKKLE